MARRTRTTESTTPSTDPVEEDTSQNTDQNEETTVAVTTEQENPTVETDKETPASEPAPEVDLDDFIAAVNAAVEERDSATGVVPEAFVAPVNEAYRQVVGLRGKSRARDYLKQQMKAAMDKMDFQLARAYLQIEDQLSAGGGAAATRERTPADPTDAFVQRIVSLQLAVDAVKDNVPENVASDWADRANKLFTSNIGKAREYYRWTHSDEDSRGDEPEVDTVVRQAVRLASGRGARGGATRTYTGERRDVGAHIQSAFADLEPGAFLTITEIRNHKSEEYGDDSPSSGAITARLFPKNGKVTIEGVEPAEENGKRGARKL